MAEPNLDDELSLFMNEIQQVEEQVKQEVAVGGYRMVCCLERGFNIFSRLDSIVRKPRFPISETISFPQHVLNGSIIL